VRAYSFHKKPSFYTISEDTQKLYFQAFDAFACPSVSTFSAIFAVTAISE
jgi:hypothetical protein